MFLRSLIPRRRQQAQTLSHKQATTADLALENARELAAVAGPWQIAADYGMLPELSLPEIAEQFARDAYHGDPSVQAAAKAGALQGFDEWLAGHPEDPYD
jgi:hypothetical protein